MGVSLEVTSEDGRPVPRSSSCSAWAREQHVDPIGTAGTYAGLVLVEWTSRWPSDVSDVPLLAAAGSVLAAKGVRLQMVKPSTASTRPCVISFRQREGEWFSGFGRRVEQVDSHEVEALAVALGRGELPHDFTSEEVDVLVCTHGTRDACCGSAGTRLALDLSAQRDDAVRPRINVWRTSHLGGHRFAPTAIVMPEGTAWAYLDPETLWAIAQRTGDLNQILTAYRGCIGIGPREAQAVDRVAFHEAGWAWLSCRRRTVDQSGGRFTVEGVTPAGERLAWSAQVSDGRELPVPICRAPIAEAVKTEAELVVSAYARDD